jgi:hypothetical protein
MRSTGEFFAGNTGSRLAAGGILAAPVAVGAAGLNSMRPSKIRENRAEDRQKKLERDQKYQQKSTLGRIGMNTASVGKAFAGVGGGLAMMAGTEMAFGYAGLKYADMFRRFA